MGRSDLRFNRGRPKDIGGRQFGYLTAIEPTGEKNRKDCIWRCRCKCGNIVELPATRLLTGNTLSCGCYTNLEDAVKARARAKQLVREDAMGLLEFYEALHKDDPVRPSRADIRKDNLPKDDKLGGFEDLESAVDTRALTQE